MRKILNGQSIDLGTCYYPEHWDESMWEEDLKRMLKAGLHTIRIAEFAWSKIEPEEGIFTYEFYDRFLDLCEKNGMQVIFCTPTATAPAWLTEKYPEVLNCDINGLPYYHGERQQTNYTSKVYQYFSQTITEKAASHYAKRPCIIGWQLDNELNCGTMYFYSESDSKEFRNFLRVKYGTLDALNDAWGTSFWNQIYTSWEQIHVPRRTINNAHNPHLELDYRLFISDVTCRFAKAQADIIRKYMKPDDFITTNGIFGNVDYRRMMYESLDEICYDSYPDFGYALDTYREDGMKDRETSENLTRTRAVSASFGIMEQQSGANGWNTRMEAPSPKPGQITLWTMQSIAHGADYVSYFRWRTCTFGTEMYWHGILDYSSRENRRLREVTEISEKTAKLQCIAGMHYEAKVGILQDFENELDQDIDRWHARIADASRKALFETLQKEHIPFDYVRLFDDTDPETLKRYDVLIYPHAEILTKDRTEVLRTYVRNGGKLVFGCRTGQKEIHGKCVQMLLPGLARDLSGADVAEYSFVSPDDGKCSVNWDGRIFEASVFNEVLAPLEGAEVIASYADTYISGSPALIRRKEGNGEVYYYGAAFSREAVHVFAEKLGFAGPYADFIEAPAEVEIAVRGNGNRHYMFVLNYMSSKRTVTLLKPVKDMMTGNTACGRIEMPPYGVLVLEL